MAKKEFQAESKKLMDMMINSIYTNKEIFLRELISNASDAIDKLYYKSLTDPSVGMNKGDFRILLTRDKDNRLLTVSDNGIGMTKEELEQNLGTIAHSGSLDFKKDNKDENIDIIGQFGVGFYSVIECSTDTLMFVLPECPRLVVIRITPFAPRTPYTALAEASFSTENDSISEISRLFKERSTPSTSTSGELLPLKELIPRIQNSELS